MSNYIEHPVPLYPRIGTRFPSSLRNIRYSCTVRWTSDLFTNVIHPSDQIPCVVVRLLPLFSSFFFFCSVASTSSLARPSSRSSSRGTSSGHLLLLFLHLRLFLLLCLRVVCVHPECQVSFSLRPCEKRETRENFRMVYGALPVLLLSHFSLPPFCMRESPPFRYISFKNFLLPFVAARLFFSLLETAEVG